MGISPYAATVLAIKNSSQKKKRQKVPVKEKITIFAVVKYI
jgi:hypothetical protein